ncbi:MAG: hypothetical protein PHY34_00260 [Patescibacteria group bacterium]|nr:hypothetical protein [Patescibacteria group bacterium]MDD5715935.1 hypothetical protein [Patescibacteria group bacterium]
MIKLPQQDYQPDMHAPDTSEHDEPKHVEQKKAAKQPAPLEHRERQRQAKSVQQPEVRPLPPKPGKSERPLPPGPPPSVNHHGGLHPTDVSKKFGGGLGDREHTHGFRNLVLTLIVLAALVATGLAATGLYDIPFLSEKFGTNKPQDLEVATSDEALASLGQKIPMTISGPQFDYAYVSPKKIYTGTVAVDAETTSAEISSWLQRFQGENPPVTKMQVKMIEGGLEISGIVDRYVKAPGYIKVLVAQKSPKSIDLTITDARLGRIPLPAWIQRKIENSFEEKINGRLGEIPNFSIETLEYHDGFSKFKGTLPANVSPSDNGWWVLLQ